MKNIIICSADYAIGATGAFHFARFVRHLNGTNDRYRIFLMTDDTAQGTPFEIVETDPTTLVSLSVHTLPKLFFLGHFHRNWAYYRAIQHFRKTQTVDVILFNQAYLGVLSRWLLPKKISIIGTIHDDQSLVPAHAAYATRKAFWYHQLIHRPLERLAMRQFDGILANSKYVQKLIIQHIQPKRLELLYQTIDVKSLSFKPQNWHITEGGLVKILFVKSGFVRGGLQDLIAALGLLSDYQFELTVVGTMPHSNALIQSWAQLFSHISLTIKGLQDTKAVTKLMHTHHILCIPARHEALGLANVEGLACGISVVTTAVGGVPEVLEEGKNGWLTPHQNPEALAETLKNCIESPPSVRRAKSERGRNFVAENFSKEGMLTRLLDVLDSFF